MAKIPKNPLAGRWIVQSIEFKMIDGTWLFFDYFEGTLRAWNFERTPLKKNRVYEGMLARTMRGAKSETDRYYFSVDGSELVIGESFGAANHPADDYDEAGFRVVKNGRRRMILYDLEHVESEPDGYYYRIVLRRRTLVSTLHEIVRSLFERSLFLRSR